VGALKWECFEMAALMERSEEEETKWKDEWAKLRESGGLAVCALKLEWLSRKAKCSAHGMSATNPTKS